MPASERFFAGGDTTVRGFALDTLGTPETIKDGFPIGGNGLVIFNAELRVPARRLGVVGFLTWATCSRGRLTSIDALRAAMGVRLR